MANLLNPLVFPNSWASDYGQDQYGLWQALTLKKPPHLIKGQDKERYGDSAEVRYVFRWMPAGTFWMGSPDDEKGCYEDEDYHSVTLSKGFWLGETPVTQALYEVITGQNPSQFKGDDLPVERVSWDDAQAFIKQMNSLHPDLKVRLPWEAEWEYACRAGTTTAFNVANDISLDLANYRGTWDDKYQWGEGVKQATTPIKSYPCNAWGLYDMHGNVWEWCEDFYTEKLGKDSAFDPIPALTQSKTSKTLHIMRGGSWNSRGRRLRSAMRDRDPSNYKDGRIGFRLAL